MRASPDVSLRRYARGVFAAPLVLTGVAAILFSAPTNAAAARATNHASATATLARNTDHDNPPQSSSQKHTHERVTCSPGHITSSGTCQVTFTDILHGSDQAGQTVCFTVSPTNAGSVSSTSGNCTTTNGGGSASGTFTPSGNVCGKAKIIATEPAEKGQTHHTTVKIKCSDNDSSTLATKSAFVSGGSSGGSSNTPAQLLLGALGVALVAAFGLRTRRLLAPRRLPASIRS